MKPVGKILWEFVKSLGVLLGLTVAIALVVFMLSLAAGFPVAFFCAITLAAAAAITFFRMTEDK